MSASLPLARLGAFSPQTSDAAALHVQLARWNHRRLAVQTSREGWAEPCFEANRAHLWAHAPPIVFAAA